MRVFWWLGLLCLGCSGAATPTATPTVTPEPTQNSPSFDCKKASTPTEKRICASAELSTLDVQMAAAWKQVAHAESLVKQQKEWLAGNAACADDPCLSARYSERIGFLKGLAAASGPVGASVSGHWVSGDNALVLLQNSDNTVKFKIFAVRIVGDRETALANGSVHLGTAIGQMPLKDNAAVFSMTEFGPCTFRFAFKGESLELVQDGGDSDCGFGMGVYAGGTYTRTDKTAPTASELEADG